MDLMNWYDAMNGSDQLIDNWLASNGSAITNLSSLDVGISITATTTPMTPQSPAAAISGGTMTPAVAFSPMNPIILGTATTAAPSFTALSWLSNERIQIICYVTILLLAIVGNTLVILTLIQNRRMRTITNVFLLNLAISDILLGVLCMPITLVGTLLRDFIFGEVMCKLLPYLQGKPIQIDSRFVSLRFSRCWIRANVTFPHIGQRISFDFNLRLQLYIYLCGALIHHKWGCVYGNVLRH